VFLSTAAPGGDEEGDIETKLLDVMLYCEACANVLFTKKVWQDARALRIEMDPEDANSGEGKAARSEVISFGVAARAKRWGITPRKPAGRCAHWESCGGKIRMKQGDYS
jgi:hypothetical protein